MADGDDILDRLTQLPQRERQALELRLDQRRSLADCAAMLGVTDANLQRAVTGGLRRLADARSAGARLHGGEHERHGGQQ